MFSNSLANKFNKMLLVRIELVFADRHLQVGSKEEFFHFTERQTAGNYR
jgi:hypothetical protein